MAKAPQFFQIHPGEIVLHIRTAAQSWHARRRVLLYPVFSNIINSDNHQRFSAARLNLRVCGLSNVPILSAYERRRTVKKILAIVQVEYGKVPLRLIVVAGRQIHNQASLVAQELRSKLFVSAELSVAHGAIVTSRSLASTFCPGATSNLLTRPAMGA